MINLKIGGELYNKKQIHSFLTEIYSEGRSPNIPILNGTDRTVKYFVAIESSIYKNDEKSLEKALKIIDEDFINEYSKVANLNLIPIDKIEESDITFIFATQFSRLKNLEYFHEMDLVKTLSEDELRGREELWSTLDELKSDADSEKFAVSVFKGSTLKTSKNSKYHILNRAFSLIRGEDVNSQEFKLLAARSICRMFLQSNKSSQHLSNSCAAAKGTNYPDNDGVLYPKNMNFSFDLALINALYTVDISELEIEDAIEKIVEFLTSKYRV